MNIVIREAAETDVPYLTLLSNQLGYPVDESNTRKNLLAIREKGDGNVYVATENNKPVAWMHIAKRTTLESGSMFEILGFVVDEACRGKGIGSILLEKAIDWCRERNASSLRVRSNIKRNEAHRFYTERGFTLKKEQKVFEMKLDNCS